MYTAGEPQGAIAAYLSWILAEGQALIQELGFVPLARPEVASGDGGAK
jgi:ABC-type phosphate transport system substrate-binding protein